MCCFMMFLELAALDELRSKNQFQYKEDDHLNLSKTIRTVMARASYEHQRSRNSLQAPRPRLALDQRVVRSLHNPLNGGQDLKTG